MKRLDYLSWDQYFMGIAMLTSMRSKDPSTQVGACIVNDEKKIVSMGYNGMPRCCSDDDFPWDKNEDNFSSKYLYVCHAELNAILNSNNGFVKGCTVYTTLFPCNECAKAIIQAGISQVVFLSDKYSESESVKASKRMFEAARVKYRQYVMSDKEIMIEL